MPDLIARMLNEGLLQGADADSVRASVEAGTPVDEALGEVPGLGEERLLPFLAEEYGVPFVDVDSAPPERDFVAGFPARVLIAHHLLPLRDDGNGAVLVATARLFDTGGLAELKKHDAPVLVQDEASSVVWGMPGSAVQAGYADEILPLDMIARRVMEIAER